MTAAYDYDADPQEPEELTMRENESLDLFEKGEDWTLVGRDNAVGFVPTAYLVRVPSSYPPMLLSFDCLCNLMLGVRLTGRHAAHPIPGC